MELARLARARLVVFAWTYGVLVVGGDWRWVGGGSVGVNLNLENVARAVLVDNANGRIRFEGSPALSGLFGLGPREPSFQRPLLDKFRREIGCVTVPQPLGIFPSVAIPCGQVEIRREEEGAGAEGENAQ